MLLSGAGAGQDWTGSTTLGASVAENNFFEGGNCNFLIVTSCPILFGRVMAWIYLLEK